LIFKHLKIDLSFIDENEIVRFYTDTKHRIFPRSPGVIGREVQNCHPKESLDKVMGVINEFREGVQDEAEFWIDTGEKFIYINFTAVRDDEGNFKGVLEMMQDVTRIRSLEGTQRLAAWKKH
ncbi:MAG: PAS domain-containing protein, partial [Tissierellaceae bacterium]